MLEIGFGLGYSARALYTIYYVYTVIDVEPIVWEKCEFKRQSHIQINLIKGQWQECYPPYPHLMPSFSTLTKEYLELDTYPREDREDGCHYLFTRSYESRMQVIIGHFELIHTAVVLKIHSNRSAVDIPTNCNYFP